ncbi:hypothetical protein PoB_002372500 [Plakobranchus ocellatus]|uniref:WAP domain-containing protein n=1 Tax=Plakobranchus ocellatus TaxID=259542 RepID=A0AAV3ZNE5_9GAST|nr:hypothetical protein PoB_002372500 [Plakobranchus ocellatus]
MYIACRQRGDLRLSGPPPSKDASGGAQTRNRDVPEDLRADSLSTLPPTPPKREGKHIKVNRKLPRTNMLSSFSRGFGSPVVSESALRSVATVLSRVRTSPPAPWSAGGPKSLRSSCCGVAFYENQTSSSSTLNCSVHFNGRMLSIRASVTLTQSDVLSICADNELFWLLLSLACFPSPAFSSLPPCEVIPTCARSAPPRGNHCRPSNRCCADVIVTGGQKLCSDLCATPLIPGYDKNRLGQRSKAVTLRKNSVNIA